MVAPIVHLFPSMTIKRSLGLIHAHRLYLAASHHDLHDFIRKTPQNGPEICAKQSSWSHSFSSFVEGDTLENRLKKHFAQFEHAPAFAASLHTYAQTITIERVSASLIKNPVLNNILRVPPPCLPNEASFTNIPPERFCVSLTQGEAVDLTALSVSVFQHLLWVWELLR